MKSAQFLLHTGWSPIPASVRVALITLAGLTGGLILIAIAAIVFFDINAYRLQVQTATSAALGMEVSVHGALGLGFSPGPYITLSQVDIRNRDTRVATAAEASLGVDITPMLFGQLRINRLRIKEPVISIDRDLDGHFNISSPGQAPRTFAALEIPEISINGATVRFFDQQSELRLEATDCDLEARHLQLTSGQSVDILEHLSFTAELGCGAFRKNSFAGANLKIHAIANHGSYELDSLAMDLFGAQGAGKVAAEFSSGKPRYRLDYTLPGFLTEAFFAMLSETPMLRGPMEFSIRLAMEGNTYQEVVRSANGDFSLRGEQLVLIGTDLDTQLDQFESSQNLNLVDVGAVFLVGPLGLLATKGYDFASLLRDQGGKSDIRTLESHWKVDRGVAEAIDVAMATNHHRIALKGKLDFANEQFDGITLALVDSNGCAELQQKISGTFQKPDIGHPGVISSLSGPIRSLAKKAVDFFTDDDCEVFYAGHVLPPVR